MAERGSRILLLELGNYLARPCSRDEESYARPPVSRAHTKGWAALTPRGIVEMSWTTRARDKVSALSAPDPNQGGQDSLFWESSNSTRAEFPLGSNVLPNAAMNR